MGEQWAKDLLAQRQKEELQQRYASHAPTAGNERDKPAQFKQVEQEFQDDLAKAEREYKDPNYASALTVMNTDNPNYRTPEERFDILNQQKQLAGENKDSELE
jgi:hypothetical protein